MGGVTGPSPAATVLRKEMVELYLRGAAPRSSIAVSAILVAIVAAGAPVLFSLIEADASGRPGSGWAMPIAAASAVLGVLGFMGLLAHMATALDAYAGERERHTLETLLTTPASDSAVLVGKAGAQLALPLGLGVWGAVVHFVAAAICFGAQGVITGLALLVAGPLTALVASLFLLGVALAASARAATVKQGQQWLALVMLPIMLLPGFATFSGIVRDPRAAVVVGAATTLVVLVAGGLAWALAFHWSRRPTLMGRAG